MKPPLSFPLLRNRTTVVLFSLFLFLIVTLSSSPTTAQTTQPFLFAAVNNSSGETTGFVTLLRNSTTGVLTMLPNTAVSFKDPCSPTTIDPTGSFLFAVCGDGVAMYTLNSTTGVVSETSSSPYFASVSTGQSGLLVAPESTGQYVYLLKGGLTQWPTPSTFTFDTFQIDPTTPALVPINSQSLSFNGTWIGAVIDPAQHGIFVYVNEQQTGSPVALLFPISFDLSTGLATIPTSGMTIGPNGRSIAISPSAGYLALGWGEITGSVTVYEISTSNFNMSLIATVNLGSEDSEYGDYTFPDLLSFSPGGNLLYAQAPPPNFAGGTSLPFLVFDPTTVTQLATPPIQVADATFLNGIADPQAPFIYVGNSGPTIYGISVFEVDLSTGLPSQPSQLSSPFYPQTFLSPLFVTIEQSGQGIQGPTLGTAPGALTFASTTTGQSSGPQDIVLKSLGAQSVSLTAIQISGANSADFSEVDNCLSSPVLPTNHSCTIAVTYAPTTVGTSEATLFITDNASGSPQYITLSGTAVAPSPLSRAVTLNPASTLTFPGTPTQGTSTAAQNVTLTNSGGAPLQVLSAVLSGLNSSDFSISADTCGGSIAANASCTISIVFSPQAAGVRTTTLTITDNATNSPQSLTISGTAVPTATITASAGGSTTATLTPGQTANFNLQITPGAGFNGTLSFSCSGAPFGATCTVPASLTVANGAPVSLTVSITTLAASQAPPTLTIPSERFPSQLHLHVVFLFAFACVLVLFIEILRQRHLYPRTAPAAAALTLSFILIFSGIGCGSATGIGGSKGSSPTSPQNQTAATPSIQPAGGTFSAAQSVSITDSTSAAIIHYTTDGSAPASTSPVYSGAFSLTSATTVHAIAVASGYSNSSVANAIFKFQTPTATFPITISVTATPAGSTKVFQLNPILLTLIVTRSTNQNAMWPSP